MRARIFAAFVGLIALFSVPVLALSLDAEAGFFVSSGEAMALTNFTNEGKQYSVLKINGDASAIFQQSDGNYAAVTDDALLAALVPAYLKTQQLPFDANVLSGVKANYVYVNREVGGCVRGTDAFYACRTPPPFACAYMWITILPDYQQALDEVKKLDIAFPGVKQGVSDLNAGMTALETGFGANDLDAISASAVTMFNAVSAIQTGYNTVIGSYSVIKPMFPYSYSYWDSNTSTSINANCTSSSELSAALNSLSTFASTTKALSTADTLNRVKSVTLSRNASSAAKRIHYFKSDSFKQTSDSARKVLGDFGAAGLVATGLNNEFTQVVSLLDSIRNASTIEDAQAKATSFDAKAAALKEKIVLYAALAPEYNASVVAKANASSQISKAAKRYGANSPTVLPLQKEYSATSNSLKAVQEKLAAGQAVSVADLQKIKANYTEIISIASGAKPQESQIDLVVVGGVAVVIIAVIAAVVFFRKFRGGGKKGKEPVDIRKLAPAQKPASSGPAIQGPPWLKLK